MQSMLFTHILHIYMKMAEIIGRKKKKCLLPHVAISISLAYDTDDMRKLILRAPSRRQSHVTIYV